MLFFENWLVAYAHSEQKASAASGLDDTLMAAAVAFPAIFSIHAVSAGAKSDSIRSPKALTGPADSEYRCHNQFAPQ